MSARRTMTDGSSIGFLTCRRSCPSSRVTRRGRSSTAPGRGGPIRRAAPRYSVPAPAIPASGMVNAAQQGLTHERCRSQLTRSKKLLASSGASTHARRNTVERTANSHNHIEIVQLRMVCRRVACIRRGSFSVPSRGGSLRRLAPSRPWKSQLSARASKLFDQVRCHLNRASAGHDCCPFPASLLDSGPQQALQFLQDSNLGVGPRQQELPKA